MPTVRSMAEWPRTFATSRQSFTRSMIEVGSVSDGTGVWRAMCQTVRSYQRVPNVYS